MWKDAAMLRRAASFAADGRSRMGHIIDDSAVDTLFREARTYTTWQRRPVEDQTLRNLYELLKWAPTSANAAPARFAFLRSKEAKERLRPALAPGNIEKTMTAPVTVIVAYDMKFYDQLPKLFLQSPGTKQMFENNPQLVEVTAQRNSTQSAAPKIPDDGLQPVQVTFSEPGTYVLHCRADDGALVADEEVTIVVVR
jgi:plastocyanin